MSSLAEVALFTDDVAAATGFYGGVLGATPVAEWPGGAIFAVGDAKILVHERTATMEGDPPNEDHFALSVADLDGFCSALLLAGYAFLVEPREYAWGRSAYLRDPDGRLLELAET